MRFRPAGSTLSVSVAALAMVAALALPALAEDPTPTDPPTEPTPDPVTISMGVSGGSGEAGSTVSVSATVNASGGTANGVSVSVSASGGSLGGACAGGCSLGDVSGSATAGATVSVPASTSDSTVTVTFSATSANAGSASGSAAVTFTGKPEPSDPPTTTPPPGTTPPPTTKDPIKLPGAPATSKGGGSSAVALPVGGKPDGTRATPPSFVPPSVSSSFSPMTDLRAPQVALPPVAPPTVAPPSSLSGATARLMANDRPLAKEPAFERLAALQTSWLSALIVAFTLLLIHVRLGRYRLATLGTAGARRRKAWRARPRR